MHDTENQTALRPEQIETLEGCSQCTMSIDTYVDTSVLQHGADVRENVRQTQGNSVRPRRAVRQPKTGLPIIDAILTCIIDARAESHRGRANPRSQLPKSVRLSGALLYF